MLLLLEILRSLSMCGFGDFLSQTSDGERVYKALFELFERSLLHHASSQNTKIRIGNPDGEFLLFGKEAMQIGNEPFAGGIKMTSRSKYGERKLGCFYEKYA